MTLWSHPSLYHLTQSRSALRHPRAKSSQIERPQIRDRAQLRIIKRRPRKPKVTAAAVEAAFCWLLPDKPSGQSSLEHPSFECIPASCTAMLLRCSPYARHLTSSLLVKWLVVLGYLVIGVLFYHIGGMVDQPCGEAALEASCGVLDESLATYVLAYEQCIFSCAEPWTAIDALYFSMVTMSTVGFGDLNPGDSWKARLFTCFFVIIGIAGPFLIISVELGRLLNLLEERFRRLICNSRAKVEVDIDGDGIVDFVEPPSASVYYLRGFSFWVLLIMGINVASAGVFVLVDPGLDYADALYICWITATTVGYGDVFLATQGARAWSCVHIAISVGALGAFIGKVQQLAAVRQQQLKKTELLKRKLDKVRAVAASSGGGCAPRDELATAPRATAPWAGALLTMLALPWPRQHRDPDSPTAKPTTESDRPALPQNAPQSPTARLRPRRT